LAAPGCSSGSSGVSRGCAAAGRADGAAAVGRGVAGGRSAGGGAVGRARPTPVTRSIRLGTRPLGRGGGSLAWARTAGCAAGAGRAGPAAPGFSGGNAAFLTPAESAGSAPPPDGL